jgi:alpha-D-ribose 1-methylphosphonate 5-triphosphate synthase subunit PhnH
MISLDHVHDIQQAYRDVLDAMSRPGLLVDWTLLANKIDAPPDLSANSAILALLLLDTETTFAVIAGNRLDSEHAQRVVRWINEMTYARMVPVEEAQFVFILAESDSLLATQALSQANIGTLLNPHESATVIIEVQAIAQSPSESFILRGPGIASEQALALRADWQWHVIRNEQNREYPLGIDLVLVDRNHQLVCLPRTTQIEQQEAN